MRRLAVLALVLATACSSHTGARSAAQDGPTTTYGGSYTSLPTAPATLPPSSSAPSPTARATTSAAPSEPVGGAVPKGFEPFDATFVSDTLGWAIGDAPCSSPPCTSVARTRDGGVTWRGIPAPRVAREDLLGLRFADARHGFAWGSGLTVTRDGGSSWSPVAGVTNVQDLETAAGTVWFTTGSALHRGSVGSSRFPAVAVPGGLSGDVGLSLHGSLVLLTSGGTRLLAGTGGAFRSVATPCQPDYRQGLAVAARTARRWLLVCGGDQAAGSQQKQAWTTTDAGAHWKAFAAPGPQGGTQLSSSSDAWLLVDQQDVQVDRGSSWTTTLASDGGLTTGGLGSSRIGFALGDFGSSGTTAMKVTHDDARTWQSVDFMKTGPAVR